MAKRFVKSRDGFTVIENFTPASTIAEIGFGHGHVGQMPVLYLPDENDAVCRLGQAERLCETSRRKKTIRVGLLPAWQVEYVEEYIERAALEGRKITQHEIMQAGLNLFYANNPMPPPRPGGRRK